MNFSNLIAAGLYDFWFGNNDQLKTSLGNLYNEVLATLDNEKNFTLICNGQEFHFNKTLLCMKSDVFARIILGSSTNSTTITDFSPETIRLFERVSFENEEIRKEEFNVEVLLFAQKYEVKTLMEKCVEHLKNSLNNGNLTPKQLTPKNSLPRKSTPQKNLNPRPTQNSTSLI